MNKKLFFLAIAALGLAACSNDDVVEINQSLEDANTISFRPLNNGMTRATEKTAFATNDQISVRANKGTADYFNALFTYNGTTFSPSVTSSHYYWPSDIADEDGKRVTFYATYGVEQTGDGAFSLSSFAGETDILFAKTVYAAKPSGGTATMNFRHALSEIVVQAKNTNAGLQAVITGVKVGYVAKSASFSCDLVTDTKITSATGTSIPNLDQSVWTRTKPTSANGFEYEKSSLSATTLTGVQSATAITGFTPWMLIPQNLSTGQSEGNPQYTKAYVNASTTAENPNLNCAYIALKMAIKNNDASKSSVIAEQWCYWPIFESWEPGKKYTYIIDVAGGGYQPRNQGPDETTTLDPVLAGSEITFNACSIDVWVTDLDEDGVVDDDINVSM
jgi:hypothetical protein